MTTANELIDRAAEHIGARSLAKPLNPAARGRMFDILLSMLDTWEANQLQIGLTIPTIVSDDLGEPGWATDPIIYGLAKMSASPLRLSKNLTPEFLKDAKEANDNLLVFASPRPQQIYPDNLPLGKGNNTGPRGRRYWPFPNTIDTENGAPITLETGDGS